MGSDQTIWSPSSHGSDRERHPSRCDPWRYNSILRPLTRRRRAQVRPPRHTLLGAYPPLESLRDGVRYFRASVMRITPIAACAVVLLAASLGCGGVGASPSTISPSTVYRTAEEALVPDAPAGFSFHNGAAGGRVENILVVQQYALRSCSGK